MTYNRNNTQSGAYAPNRLRHLSAIWDKYLSEQSPPQLDRWIASMLAENKNFGKKDRRFYSDAMFAAVRHGLFAYAVSSDAMELDDILKRAEDITGWDTFRSAVSSVNNDTFFRNVFARAGLYHEEDDVSRRCGNIMNMLRSAPASLIVKAGMLLHSIPFSLSELIGTRDNLWNDPERSVFLEMLDTRPPLWIRVNDIRNVESVASELKRDGFTVKCADGAACALTGDPALYHSPVFKEGKIEIQDYASQKIGMACDIAPGMYVWDACAGGGGKTMQIASLLQGKGAVYASDIREYKLEETRRRARKAGFSNVRTIPWDGNTLPFFPKEVTSRHGFHRILVDAPCSASGTWRRNPDAKYRITPQSVEELSSLQLSILSRSSESLREGGVIVYATCSFFTVENEDVVAKFMSSHPGFELLSMNLHGSPSEDGDTTFTAVIKKLS